MKNRKTVVVAFLLVAAMVLGVGYATLTEELTITGDAIVAFNDAQEAFEDDIYFSAVDIGDPVTSLDAVTGTITATVDAAAKPDEVTFAIPKGVLASEGDYITFTYTIKSESDLTVYVDLPTITNTNTEYFSVAIDWQAQQTLTAGGTVDVVVTVTVEKTPADEDVSAKFTLTFNADTTQP